MNIAAVCRRTVRQARAGEALEIVAARMRAHDVGMLVVVDERGQAIGIVTDRDLVLRVLAEGRDPARTRVEDVMSAHPRSLPLSTTVEDALAVMRALCVRRMPVIGPNGELAGVVSAGDLLAHLARELGDLTQVLARATAGPLALIPTRRFDPAGLERAASDPEC